MDALASPLITVLANVVADLLVSKGIIDTGSKVAVIQLINNGIAGLMTLGVAVYSMYKVVELKKHQLTLAHSAPIATKTVTVEKISQPISQKEAVGQMGVVPEQKSAPTI